ncbi:MAG: amidohydrolase family protein [Acidobacteria bacterium]|nr:amidohydrolase family protein [Acidobacteriota bacterium]
MRLGLLAFALVIAQPSSLSEPVKIEELAKPPANAKEYIILSTAGVHGHSYCWTDAEGIRYGRESLLLRGQAFESDSKATVRRDGMIEHLVIRGFTPSGDAGETFDINNGVASWKSPVDSGSAPYRQPAMYSTFGGPADVTIALAEALVAAPSKSLALLPGGQAHAAPLTTLVVGSRTTMITVQAYAITGISNSPVPIWMDPQGKFFAFDQGLTWIRKGYEADQPQVDKAQDDALAKYSVAIARSLPKFPTEPVAFTHVKAFVEGNRFVEDQNVIVDRGLITQVGPFARTTVPANAQVVDGTGKTLVPGLWDAHQHVAGDFTGPMLMALGITSVRDPGSNSLLTLARAERRAKGELLMPHVYPSMLIDGRGPNTAQLGSVATSLDDAIAMVRKAKADGFVAIKFYGTFSPAWVKPTAAEAHRLGLHVHGHLPAGMRTLEAINDGYDEITHIYFVIMQAMPDAVVNKSDGLARMEGPGRYAKDVDLDAEPMKSLIEIMARGKIVSDPTLVVAESLYVPNNGDLSAAYAPYIGTLPPTLERGFRSGGLAVPSDLTRADYRASFAKLCALVEDMHKAGVPIVAGTDGFGGLELVHELEIYVSAGFTPEEALAAATLIPAQLVSADKTTGSISVGKKADLVLVEGDPSKHIGDLRQTRVVMMDGKMMDADALRRVSGFSGRPKSVD